MRVQVVFLADVPPKHMAGDVRAVAGGYARNYLIPQGLAAPATIDHLKRIEKIKRAAESKRARDASDLKGVADLLEGLSVTLKGRSGQGGRLYGSITNIAIAEALTERGGARNRPAHHHADELRSATWERSRFRCGCTRT